MLLYYLLVFALGLLRGLRFLLAGLGAVAALTALGLESVIARTFATGLAGGIYSTAGAGVGGVKISLTVSTLVGSTAGAPNKIFLINLIMQISFVIVFTAETDLEKISSLLIHDRYYHSLYDYHYNLI